MAADVTLEELRARVRRLANLETAPASSQFAGDTVVDEAINRQCKQLYDKLRVTRPRGFYQREDSWTVTASDPYLPLPADFLELLTIWAYDGSVYVPLDPFEPHELPVLLQAQAASAGNAYTYRYSILQDDAGLRLELRPMPANSSDQVFIRYTPAFRALDTESSGFDGINGWEDWACYRAAMDLMNREESDISGLMAVWQVIDKNIDDLASARDAGRGRHVQDVERDAYWVSQARRYP